MQTFVEKGFRFRCYCDPLGTSRFAAVAPDLCIDVVPGRPEAIEMAASRIVRRGAAFPLRVRTEDAWGNTCWNTGGIVDVSAALDGRPVYERAVELAPEGWATALIDDLPAGEAGELAVTARLRDAPRVGARTFYVTVDEAFAYARNYFGDLHVHSDDTVGTNDTRYNLTYGRDVAGLDVLGYTANDFNVTKERWDKAVALIHALNRPGTFVCYPGTEWCGSSCAGGDHNVVFLRDGDPEFPFDRHGNVCRSFEWNEDMASDTIEPGAWPLEELWATYIHDPEGHLLIPTRGTALHPRLASPGAGAPGRDRIGVGAFSVALRRGDAPRVQAGRRGERRRAPRTLRGRGTRHRGVRHPGRGDRDPGRCAGPRLGGGGAAGTPIRSPPPGSASPGWPHAPGSSRETSSSIPARPHPLPVSRGPRLRRDCGGGPHRDSSGGATFRKRRAFPNAGSA